MARNDLPAECCGCKQHLPSLGVCAEHTARGFDLQDSVVRGKTLPVWCYKRKTSGESDSPEASSVQQWNLDNPTP